MQARARNQITALVALFGGTLLILVTAGIGGLVLVDIARGYVAGEGFYSKAQKAAVLALHRYARWHDPADFARYAEQISVPESDRLARELIEDDTQPAELAYPLLIQGNNHPDDVAGLVWLFRVFGETSLFAPALDHWRAGDQALSELQRNADALQAAVTSGADPADVSAILERIDEIDRVLTHHESAFSQEMGDTARRLTALIQYGLAGLGLLLALIAIIFSVHTQRRMKAAAREIERREERFRDVADMAADWIWETDAEHRFSYLSSRLERVTNLPVSEFLGRRRWEVVPDPGPGGWSSHIAAVNARREFSGFEYQVTGRDGVERAFRISGRPIFADDGSFFGYRGTGTDVSQEVAARRAVAVRQELLETTFENLGQGIAMIGADLNVAVINRRFLELLDFPADEFRVGDPFEKFYRYNVERGEYADVEAISAQMDKARACQPYAYERTRANGTVLEVRGMPLASGGLVSTVRDVTAEREAEKAARDSARRTRAVIDGALDAFVSTDAADIIVDWNPAAERMFGWSRSEAVGQCATELLVAESARKDHARAIRSYLRTDSPTFVGRLPELTAIRRDGSEISVELSISSRSVDGRKQLDAFIRDITERKEAEHGLRLAKEAAEVANQAKNEFLANMSHELRTPLNAIIGFADLMRQRMMGPLSDRYAEYATDIRDSGDHLLALISDILDISCVEAGKTNLTPEPLNLAELVEFSQTLMAQRAGDKDVEIVNAIPADLPRLMADPRRMRQVVINLLGNAIKFSPPGSAVRVHGSISADGLTLDITDNGSGMDANEIERVFEPFVQLRKGTGQAHEGAGLGLALVKQFVELHGGSIAIESATGTGTSIRVTFPPARIVARGADEAQDTVRDGPLRAKA